VELHLFWTDGAHSMSRRNAGSQTL